MVGWVLQCMVDFLEGRVESDGEDSGAKGVPLCGACVCVVVMVGVGVV